MRVTLGDLEPHRATLDAINEGDQLSDYLLAELGENISAALDYVFEDVEHTHPKLAPLLDWRSEGDDAQRVRAVLDAVRASLESGSWVDRKYPPAVPR